MCPPSNHLQERYLVLYQPDAEISINEWMVKSKARFSFYKQYIRNKPTKLCFKLWCLCDSQTGYTVNFVVYCGKEGEIFSKHDLGCDVVMKLVAPLVNQRYQICMDNYYTSPNYWKICMTKKHMVLKRWLQIKKGFQT